MTDELNDEQRRRFHEAKLSAILAAEDALKLLSEIETAARKAAHTAVRTAAPNLNPNSNKSDRESFIIFAGERYKKIQDLATQVISHRSFMEIVSGTMNEKSKFFKLFVFDTRQVQRCARMIQLTARLAEDAINSALFNFSPEHETIDDRH